MGPSGSGKSTFMNILGCLDRPTSGSYILDGVDVSGLDRDERAEIRNGKIGFVFQCFNLLARTSALENVELPLIYAPTATAAQRAREQGARGACAIVGLAGPRGPPAEPALRRPAAARRDRARADQRPELILADEPTGNLDTKTSEEVMAVFQELNDEGKTVVLITHEPDIARVRAGASSSSATASSSRTAPVDAAGASRAAGGRRSAMLKFLTILKVGLQAIARNKLRSALTTLGIIIGVACVIAMIGVGQGVAGCDPGADRRRSARTS